MRISLRAKPTSGTTLTEVVLAIVVIGILGAALMGSYAYGFHIMRLVRENQRATQIILEKVETIRLYNWYQVLTPEFIPTTFTEVYDPQAEPGHQGIVYNGTLTVTNYPVVKNYQNDLRRLVITLTWTSGNLTRSRSLTTLVAKDGLQNYVY